MYKVVGIKNVNYVSKEGRNVIGVKLQCLYNSSKVEGFGVSEIFVSAGTMARNNISSFNLNDEVELLYNRYGNIEQIAIKGE